MRSERQLFIYAAMVAALAGPAVAQSFRRVPGNIPGMDYTNFEIAPNLDVDGQVRICERACANDGRCMAYTWVRAGIQAPANPALGPTARCWLKADARLFPPLNPSLVVSDANTRSGVKPLGSSSCWARHVFNLKFCAVFTGLQTCPAPARGALLNTGSPSNPFNNSCVIRLATDPGGLPNCTDAFGGDAHEAGVLGSRVNQACLDSR